MRTDGLTVAYAIDLAERTVERAGPTAGLAAGATQAAHAQAVQRLPAGLSLLGFKARLDNHAELAAALRLPQGQGVSVESLLLAAYRRWGADVAQRLRGDWWFALWDGEQRHLLLARDATGSTPVFYCPLGKRLAFSDSVVSLLRVKGMAPQVCEQRVVSLLLRWVYADPSQTEYEGVLQLLSGHCLTWNEHGLSVRRYWSPQDLVPVRLATNADYVAGFLELYRRAVAARTGEGRRVGCMLSAGLDSGSVTALAARELARRGERLQAFTHRPLAEVRSLEHPSHLVDEWPLAQAVARQAGSVEHVEIDSAHVNPLQAIWMSLERTGLMYLAGPIAPWLHVLHQTARQAGIDTLLNGQFGNFVVSWEGRPSSIWPLVRQGRWSQARTVLLGQRPNTLPMLLRALAGRLKRACIPARQPRVSRLATVLQPSLAAAWQDALESQIPPFSLRSPEVFRDFMMPRLTGGTVASDLLAASYGLQAYDPTNDQQLLEYCLALPSEQFSDGVHDRWLMRRGMQGLLPPQVQCNVRRGLQPADCSFRLLAHRGDVEAVLALMQRSELARRYLNLNQLRLYWEQVKPSVFYGESLALLYQGLGTGMWLAHMEGLKPDHVLSAR